MAMFSEGHVSPVVLSGNRENRKSVVYFRDSFNSDSIRDLINDIEVVRQSGNFNEVDLYFISDGGLMTDMYIFKNYLENLENFTVNIIVAGPVCSAAFWLLVMLNDVPHIEISYTMEAVGMIHLANIMVDVRGLYGDNPTRTKFLKKETDLYNDTIKMTILPHLGLSKKQIKTITDGGDVWLSRAELIHAIDTYKEYYYCISGDLKDYYDRLQAKIDEYKVEQKRLINTYKHATGRDLLKDKDERGKLTVDGYVIEK